MSGVTCVDVGDGSERVVDLQFAPRGERRDDRHDDGGRVPVRAFLERLRADQHADVEQDRRDRDDRDERRHQRDDAEPREHDDHDAGRGGVADAAAHRLPAGMADIDGVDVRIAHQAADEADHAVGREHARGRVFVAGRGGAHDVVHRFDEIVDAEGNRGDEDDAQGGPIQPAEDEAEDRARHGEAEGRERSLSRLSSFIPPKFEAEEVRAPGDQRAGGDGDQAGGNAAVFHAAEPAHQDDREADHADDRRHEHLQRRASWR